MAGIVRRGQRLRPGQQCTDGLMRAGVKEIKRQHPKTVAQSEKKGPEHGTARSAALGLPYMLVHAASKKSLP